MTVAVANLGVVDLLLSRQVRVGGEGAALFLGLFLALGGVLLLLRRRLGLVVHTGLLLPTVPELDGWKHCPCCRADLRRDENKVECDECGFAAYGSSKPTASGLLLDDVGRVLLSRRAVDPFAGKWDLPGGFLEEGEHPLDALRRELKEEAGVEIEPLWFVGVWADVYGDRGLATVNLYWTARIVAGEPAPADDVDEFRWFAPHDVPRDELAFDHLSAVISALGNQHA